MSRLKIMGLVLIIVGIGMMLLGASIFAYQGKSLSQAISTLGLLSFILCLPTIITGIILIRIKK